MATYYRLRSIKQLVEDFRELERQEIYFASPKELNDPTEGLAYMAWRGDHVAWTNLFTHYLRCLHTMCGRAMEDETVALPGHHIPILDPMDNDLSSDYNSALDTVVPTVLAKANLEELIDSRLNWQRTIRVDELRLWLQCVHPHALTEIRRAHSGSDARQIDNAAAQLETISAILREMKGIDDDSLESTWVDTIRYASGQDLMRKYKLGIARDSSDAISRLLIFDFPNLYVKELERLLYPNWYVACFMDTYSNASIWGHYGDGHSGVCLIWELYA